MKKQYLFPGLLLLGLILLLGIPFRSQVSLEQSCTAFLPEAPDTPIPVTVSVEGTVTHKLLRPYTFLGLLHHSDLPEVPGQLPPDARPVSLSLRRDSRDTYPGKLLQYVDGDRYGYYGNLWILDGFDSFILTRPLDTETGRKLVISCPGAASLDEVFARVENAK